jgi:hypothetical protein
MRLVWAATPFPLNPVPSWLHEEGGTLCEGAARDVLIFISAPQLLGRRARGVAMLGVFLVSAVVHEYIFCFVLGFFYPVMLMLFLVFGGECNLYGPRWEAACGRRPGCS